MSCAIKLKCIFQLRHKNVFCAWKVLTIDREPILQLINIDKR